MANKKVIAYMCQTDWDFELGEACGGTKLYPSVEDLKENRKCVKQCGIVQVKVTLTKLIDPGKGFSSGIQED